MSNKIGDWLNKKQVVWRFTLPDKIAQLPNVFLAEASCIRAFRWRRNLHSKIQNKALSLNGNQKQRFCYQVSNISVTRWTYTKKRAGIKNEMKGDKMKANIFQSGWVELSDENFQLLWVEKKFYRFKFSKPILQMSYDEAVNFPPLLTMQSNQSKNCFSKRLDETILPDSKEQIAI